jgi:hypothetical protein
MESIVRFGFREKNRSGARDRIGGGAGNQGDARRDSARNAGLNGTIARIGATRR